MKTVILAGGFGTRLSEETIVRPKPMVEIGGRPIIWHIMNIYAAHGITEFLIALGYKGEVIKEFFLNYQALSNDFSINLPSGKVEIYQGRHHDWTVHLVDTGIATQTGGRILRMGPWIGKETFMVTYGDGVADINITKLIEFHESHGKLVTMTAVRPPARFGLVKLDGDRVIEFAEKPQMGEGWINGGFFALEPGVFEYVSGDSTVWERQPLERLALDGELMAYRHEGFWQPMDTMRDKRLLEELWNSGTAPWKVWE